MGQRIQKQIKWNFLKAVSTIFTWFILEYFDPYKQKIELWAIMTIAGKYQLNKYSQNEHNACADSFVGT